MGTNRLEMFSDGVIAIAITLLVLDLHVPQDAGSDLGRALLEQWPAYAAYATTFLTIGVMWVNHHVIFATVARADRALLFWNLLLLFGIATLPFTTSLAASYLTADEGASQAMVVYAGWGALIATTFTLLLGHLGRHRTLRLPQATDELNRAGRLRAMAGVAAYAAAAAVAVMSPIASLVLCLAMPVYYIVAGRRLTQTAFEMAE